MKTTSHLGTALALPLLFAVPAAAQLAAKSDPIPASFRAPSAWRFPIHTQPADPVGGEYGTWACGETFKVSFHDGYAFYPILGSRYPENLPLAWRDTKVTAGGEALIPPGSRPVTHHTDWRFEYRYPLVTEAYDVLENGVEQTFIVRERPAPGDLVVRGEIVTKLRAEPTAAEHQKLVFRDEHGNAIVEYGAAFAIDANGARFPMTTRWDGSGIALTLAAAAVANAQFPLVIDPLTSSVAIATSVAGSDVQEPEIGRDDYATINNLMFAYSRLASASDYDGYVRVTNNDYSNTTMIFSDLTTSWSTRNNQVAFVGGSARKWLVAFQRDFTSSSGIRFIVSPSGSNAVIPSATYYSPSVPSGYQTARNPDVGGLYSYASSGSSALLICQCDATTTNANTANTEVFARLIDLSGSTPVSNTPFIVSASASGTRFDREFPSCTQVKLTGSASWIVAWQQFDNTLTNDDWDIKISRITASGAVAGESFLAQASASDHAVTPRVEGNNGRYMGTYATVLNTNTKYSGTTGSALECQRFDWSESASAPTIKAIRTLAPTGTLLSYSTGNIAYDTDTDSHWAITYVRRSLIGLSSRRSVIVERVGFSGGTVETATVYSNSNYDGYAPSITFDDDLNEFKICFASSDANETLYARSLTYSSAATYATFGTSCGSATISANRKPNAGDEYFAVTIAGAPANQMAGLLISTASYNFNLGSIGMPGCALNVNPAAGIFLTSINRLTNASGAASVNLPLPDFPVAVMGNFYLQWLYLSPGGNPANLQATHGLVVSIH